MYEDCTQEEKGAEAHAAFVVIGGYGWNYILKSSKRLIDGLAKGPFYVNKLPGRVTRLAEGGSFWCGAGRRKH